MRKVLGLCLLIPPCIGSHYYLGSWVAVGEILALVGAGVLAAFYLMCCAQLIVDREDENESNNRNR